MAAKDRITSANGNFQGKLGGINGSYVSLNGQMGIIIGIIDDINGFLDDSNGYIVVVILHLGDLYEQMGSYIG
jgi:hypothetical protein